MAPPNLPTKKEFAKATSGGTFDRRNKIAWIDNALEKWHAERTLDNSIRVYKESRHWLKAKAAKNSKNTNKRRGEVQSLIASAAVWIEHQDPVLAQRWRQFDAKKARGAHAAAKAMPGVYQHERSLYVQSRKTGAPSASLLDHQHYQLQQSHGFAEKFGSLSEAEFKRLDDVTGHTHRVIYLRKMDRLRRMLVAEGGFLLDFENQRANTDLQFGWPYAMDKYGSVFTTDDQKAGGQFNHSSFNAGNDVICAGFIKVDRGQVLSISNNSGHYKPSAENLANAIQMLGADNVDLTRCKVELHDFVSDPGYLVVWEYPSVPLFMFNYALDRTAPPVTQRGVYGHRELVARNRLE